MKIMLMWLRKGHRKPKMEGLATADDSASRIWHMCQSAKKGYGRAYIIEAKSADAARQIIYQYKKLKKTKDPAKPFNPRVILSLHDDHVVAIGHNAVLAIAGASEAIRLWEYRRKKHVGVPVHMTKALHPINLKNLNLDTVFGQELFK
tara:strand:- start:99 stop:542 length:444 start_codon:yes stop_codon:yes gene_type:complete